MGYRSEVGLCLTKNGHEALLANLAKVESEPSKATDIATLLKFCNEKREQDGAAAWIWKWIKWYHEFQDVAFIEKLLAKLKEEDYLFIRVGEDDEDVECQGEYWDNPFGMSLVRGVAFA